MTDLNTLVAQLKQQGKSNQDILDILSKQGYNYQDIVNAISNYDLSYSSQNISNYYDPYTDQIQAIAESIVGEKINEIISNIQSFYQINQNTLARLEQAIDNLKNLEDRIDRMEKNMNDFQNNITNLVENINSEIKAFEGVFEKIASGLVESTKELKFLIDKAKEKD